MNDTELELWEVFAQKEIGAPHEHCGSLHASDTEMALQNARDVYCRRNEAINIWVVQSKFITSSTPDDSPMMFDPAKDKIYRHPQFYTSPKKIKNLF